MTRLRVRYARRALLASAAAATLAAGALLASGAGSPSRAATQEPMIEGGNNTWDILGGNAQSGSLFTGAAGAGYGPRATTR